MIVAEIRHFDLNDWRGQLRDLTTNQLVGDEWRADQRGALIGKMREWLPLTHLTFVDRGDMPSYLRS